MTSRISGELLAVDVVRSYTRVTMVTLPRSPSRLERTLVPFLALLMLAELAVAAAVVGLVLLVRVDLVWALVAVIVAVVLVVLWLLRPHRARSAEVIDLSSAAARGELEREWPLVNTEPYAHRIENGDDLRMPTGDDLADAIAETILGELAKDRSSPTAA
jgi:hypothetical protein